MRPTREQLLQELLKQIGLLIRSMSTDFPFGAYRLTRAQVGVLLLLSREKAGISVKDLAKELRVTSGAITQLLDDLVEMKLVSRQEDPDDRRAANIRLTRLATSKFMVFRKKYFERVSPMFEELSVKELDQMTRLLKKIKTSAMGGRAKT